LPEIGERELVRLISKAFRVGGVADGRDVQRGIGDDCAVLDLGEELLLITTDMVSARTHFQDTAPRDMGWHLMAVNLSDIAAMGGYPVAAVVALGLCKDLEERFVLELVDGILECAERFAVPIVGGDTKETSDIVLCATIVGKVAKGKVLYRTGAMPGDLLCVTGPLGRAAAGHEARSSGRGDEVPGAIEAITRPFPRLDEGRFLSSSGVVTSCMDISDGLASCLGQMWGEDDGGNGPGFLVRWDSVPVAPEVGVMGLDPVEAALHWGGDYELVFTVARGGIGMLGGMNPIIIGEVVGEKGIWLEKDGKRRRLEGRGWEHFKSKAQVK